LQQKAMILGFHDDAMLQPDGWPNDVIESDSSIERIDAPGICTYLRGDKNRFA
jgi:hypothetical protein